MIVMTGSSILTRLLVAIYFVVYLGFTEAYVDAELLKTKLLLRRQHLGPSRCLNLCQNDQYCKSGQCILTECSDTIACYKYCMLCNSQLNCYQSGEFCTYNGAGSRINTIPSLTIILTVCFLSFF